MEKEIHQFLSSLKIGKDITDLLVNLSFAALLIFISYCVYLFINKFFVRKLELFFNRHSSTTIKYLASDKIVHKAALLIFPIALIILLPIFTPKKVAYSALFFYINQASYAYIAVILAFISDALLNFAQRIYNTYPISKNWPIKRRSHTRDNL